MARNSREPKGMELEQLLGYQLRRASATMMADLSARLAPLELTPISASILLLIGSNRGITQSEIGRILSIKRTNLVPTAANLQARGLIERKRVDGRSHGLELSAAGGALATQVRRQMRANERRFKTRVDPALIEPLISALGLLWRD